MRAVIGVLAGTVVACAAAEPTGDAPPVSPVATAPKSGGITADEVMSRMISTYSGLTTYTDRGSVTLRFTQPPTRNEFASQITFETVFVKPDRFRFGFRDDGVAHVLWNDKGISRIVSSFQSGKVVETRDMGVAIAALTGISEGSAHTIPRLLLPSVVSGFGLESLNSPEIVRSTLIDGHACFEVKGRMRNSPVVVWIDLKNYLIRRVERTRLLANALEVQETVIYDPVADARIDDSQLAGPDITGRQVEAI